MILKEFEGLPGGRGELAASNSKTIIAYPYYLSIVTYKWFEICEMRRGCNMLVVGKSEGRPIGGGAVDDRITGRCVGAGR